MVSEWTMLLHVGQEITVLEYLYRVLFHLLGFGGIALLVYSLMRIIGSVQFPRRDTEDNQERPTPTAETRGHNGK